MSEKDQEITTDDMSVLRVLLHRIRGITAVSSTTDYLEAEPGEE